MKPTDIVFLFLHEMQHQILHTVPIMDEVARNNPDFKIRAFVRGANNLDFIKTFLAPDALARITFIEADSGPVFRSLEGLSGRSVPFSRYGFLYTILEQLKSADIIVSPETTCLILKRFRSLAHVRFVFVPHGAGDRAVSFEKAIRNFDHVFVPGDKTLARMIEEGVTDADHAVQIGYPKFLAVNQSPPTGQDLFSNDNPIFLYNPHFDPFLSSWYDIGEDVLDVFLERPDVNLICAPHVMMYHRLVQISKDNAIIKPVPKIPDRYRDAPNIVIDTGSQRCVDMTYTRLADVYIGDVSSQVYEFIYTPRPVIYLNPKDHDWENDPYFTNWHFGTVYANAQGLADHIDAGAHETNPHEQQQRSAAEKTFGKNVEQSASIAAKALSNIAGPQSKSPLTPAWRVGSSKTGLDKTKHQTSRIFKNFGKLASGKVIAAVLSLAYLAIVARSLGPDGMGYLVLAHAYVLIVGQVARFQSWQAIIRFGDPLLAQGKVGGFKALVRFTAKLDILSAFLAVGISLLLLPYVAKVMEWPAEAMDAITAYCWAGPFLIAATPTGLLQLKDKFGTLSWQLLILPGTRFIGALWLWFIGADLVSFMVIWIVSAVMHGASLWALAWVLLNRNQLLPSWRASGDEETSEKWWPFVIKTNLASTVELSHSQLPLLIVGAVLGGAASGFFQLAINLTNLIAHPTNLLNEATFPELSKINTAEGRAAMRDVALRSLGTGVLIAAPVVVIYVIWREQLATFVGGEAFLPAGIIIAWMAFAQVWRIASVVLESAVLATDGAGFVLFAQCVAAVCIIAGMGILLPQIGAVGAPISLLIAMIATVLLYLMTLNRPAKQAV